MKEKNDSKQAAIIAMREGLKRIHSPTERHREKVQEAMLWVYRWGFTSPAILRKMFDSAGREGALFVKKHLLQEHPIEGGGILQGVPRKVYTLTKSGLEIATEQAENQLNYDTANPERNLKRAQLRHDLLAQKIALEYINSGAKLLSTAREMEHENALLRSDWQASQGRTAQPWSRIPDFLAVRDRDTDSNGNPKAAKTFAIEIELTPKWDRELHQFVTGLAEGIDDQRWQVNVIFTPSAAIVRRYRELFTTGAAVHTYDRTPQRRWLQNTHYPYKMKEAVADKTVFLDLNGKLYE
ncbi:MAG: hypothetical protein WCY67_08175 [Acidithiobacillus sp.]